MNKFRWGILSTAGIARKNWRAIRDSGNSAITAVASRDAARGRQFIEHCQRDQPADCSPAALGSYEALVESKEVDGIYVPLPTGLRKEWVLRAAAAGKHVLCEKPCGLSAGDVRQMTDACQKNRVQFMDGVMFMHNPRMARLREVLDDGKTVGPIRRVTSIFSFSGNEAFYDHNIRIHSELEPAGCLGDLGWYCLRFALWAMHWRLPSEVSGRVLSACGNRLSPASAPTDFSGELIFADGTSMGFYCSFRAQFQNWVRVGGALGYLHVADFVHPASVEEPAFEVNGAQERVKPGDGALPQDARMFRDFVRQAASGELNEDWPRWALQTQQVMDACLESARNGGTPVKLN